MSGTPTLKRGGLRTDTSGCSRRGVPANSSFTRPAQIPFGKDLNMARWQRLAETNPCASPEQQTLLGLMVVAELENSGLAPDADPEGHDGITAVPASTGLNDVS